MKDIVITLDEQYANQVGILASSMRSEGLKVKQVYSFGIITGSADEPTIHKLRQHKEVVTLKEQKKIQIAPPTSLIQ